LRNPAEVVQLLKELALEPNTDTKKTTDVASLDPSSDIRQI
jgi:hypothetical protein